MQAVDDKALYKSQSIRSLNKCRGHSITERVELIHKDIMGLKSGGRGIKSAIRIGEHSPNTNLIHRTENVKEEGAEQLQKRLKILERQLKRKFTENNELSKLFQMKNSSTHSHIDIYVKMKQAMEKLQGKQAQIVVLREAEVAREQVITDLRKEIEIQEYKHIETIKSVSEQVDEKLKLLSEFKGKVNQLQSSLQEREQLHEGDRYLMGQLKRKNKQLITKIDKLNEELQIERGSKELQRMGKQQEIIDFQQIEAKLELVKDENQKLSLRLKESEQALEEQRLQHFQALQKNKSVIYQLQLQSSVEQRNLRNQIDDLYQEHNKLIATIDDLTNEKQQLQQLIEQALQQKLSQQAVRVKMQAQMAQMENIKQKLLSEVAKTEQKCIELTGGIKVLKFERDDINSLVTKIKGEKEQALQTCELLEDKCTLNAKLITSLQKKLEEETHSESSQSLLRLNSRLHAENYKAIGRIIELNSKIRQTLHSDNVRKSSEEEQLGEVLSDFALHLETLINAYFSAKQQCSQATIVHENQLKQCLSVFESIRMFLPDQDARTLLKEYMVSLQRKTSKTVLAATAQRLKERLSFASVQQQTQPQSLTFCRDSLQETQMSTHHLHSRTYGLQNVRPYKYSYNFMQEQEERPLRRQRKPKKMTVCASEKENRNTLNQYSSQDNNKPNRKRTVQDKKEIYQKYFSK